MKPIDEEEKVLCLAFGQCMVTFLLKRPEMVLLSEFSLRKI